MGWDRQWDTHASVEGQVDIPWNVPLSHGTVGWDGQFTAFLDIYGLFGPADPEQYPNVTEAFKFAVTHPFQHLEDSYSTFQLLKCFTCVLYDKTTSICEVNELRQDLFSKKVRAMENIPPTKVKMIYYCVSVNILHTCVGCSNSAH